MRYLTNLFESTASVYERTREIMAKQYDVQCHCPQCQWVSLVDITEVDYFTLEDLKNNMACPHCDNVGLNVKTLAKKDCPEKA